jgi:hypothetical protein
VNRSSSCEKAPRAHPLTSQLTARIAAAANVRDTLTHDRPYKKAWSQEDALAEIAPPSGTTSEPVVGASFPSLMRHPNPDSKRAGAFRPDSFLDALRCLWAPDRANAAADSVA